MRSWGGGRLRLIEDGEQVIISLPRSAGNALALSLMRLKQLLGPFPAVPGFADLDSLAEGLDALLIGYGSALAPTDPEEVRIWAARFDLEIGDN